MGSSIGTFSSHGLRSSSKISTTSMKPTMWMSNSLSSSSGLSNISFGVPTFGAPNPGRKGIPAPGS
eukprot:7133621-Karenia_brevis.AAC.1